jgi:hypothetical protein
MSFIETGVNEMDKLAGKTEALSVEMLKEMISELVNDFRDGADLVLSACMAALSAKLPEDEYVAFLDGVA